MPSDPFGRMSHDEMSPWEPTQLPFAAFDSPTPLLSNSEFNSPTPLLSNSDSDIFRSPSTVISNHVSEYMDQTQTKPGLEESTRAAPFIDERKRRRMISNRESARRSRMRKQNHIENLRNELKRLRNENRQLLNHLQVALYNYNRQRMENDRLQSEQIVLRRKLLDLSQIMIFRQLQQFPTASPYYQNQTQTNNYVINNMINT